MCWIDLIWFSFSSSKPPLRYSFLDGHWASVRSKTQVVLHLELRIFLCKWLMPQENLILSIKEANVNLMHLRNKSPEFIYEVHFYSLGNLL